MTLLISGDLCVGFPEWGGTPILGHGREVLHFGGFQSDWVPILYLNTIRLTPSFNRKNWFVSITFSSRDTRT